MSNAVIAMHPSEMAAAQTQVMAWCDARIGEAKRELADAEATFDALNRSRLPTNRASRLINKANRRVTFYDKVRAALDAGYVIVPPFALQLFAIKTDRVRPPRYEGDRGRWDNEQRPRVLPAGKGAYVAPTVERYEIDRTTTGEGPSKRVEVTYANSESWGDVEIPIRALKPQIIDAVGIALERKVFDALGIAPAYRAADPVVCGIIKRPGGGELTFLVAWWLDRSDL